jgi:hypothetical protein
MASNSLIKQVAEEYGWSQADIKRAIENSQGTITTKEEIIVCMIRYAGPALLKRNRELGQQKRVSNQQKETIRSLVEHLTKVQDFYAIEFIPLLRATIDTQAQYIKDLLKQVSEKNRGDSNG